MTFNGAVRVFALSGTQTGYEPTRQSPMSNIGRFGGAKAVLSPSTAQGFSSQPQPAAGAVCSSVAVAEPSVQILDMNEYRRGVGLCVFNARGLVFAAR